MRAHGLRALRVILACLILVSSGIAFRVQPQVAAAAPVAAAETIRINASAAGTAIDSRILGTNLPAWVNPSNFANTTFRARTQASGTTLVRIPGGSWSNYYDWLACERGGAGIDGNAQCYWPWASRPTDFIDFLQSTGQAAMYTVNMNGTAKEAAALVAFFNGAVNDERSIGVDVRGRDWKTVGYWARLRSDNGNPEPFKIRLWEVGNEIYGGNQGSGKDCTSWGWETVWTCDGTEYVNGIGNGSSRHEGYREFRDAMRAVDSSIQVGAVGVSYRSDWSNWGNEVVAAAGAYMDFYSIHQYAFFQQPSSFADALAEPQSTWGNLMQDARTAFNTHAGGRDIPVAVTEHNLFSVQEQDNSQWMTRAVNVLFMADTLGQMGLNGVDMANQWDVANGTASNGTDYGLMKADGFARNPQYYVYPLWSRFGNQMIPVTASLPAATTLSVYAGRVDNQTISLLAINKTGNAITTAVSVDGVASITGGSVDVVRASSLDSQSVTFNGSSNPSDDLSNAPSTALSASGVPFDFTFAPYSVTLIRMKTSGQVPTATASPVTTSTPPTATTTPVATATPSVPGSALNIYADALNSGWVNWSWNTNVNFSNSSPRQTGNASAAVTYNAAWAGFYLHAQTPLAIGSYDTLRFWVHGGSSGGQSLSVILRDTSGNGSSAVPVTVRANTWTQVDIPLTNLNGLSNIADIIWQDTKGASQPTFYLDAISLLNSQSAVSPTATRTPTRTGTAVATATRTPTRTGTAVATRTPTRTATAVATATRTPTRTGTAVATATRTPTRTPTVTATTAPVSTRNIYIDALDSGWANWSWNTNVNFSNSNPRQGGSASAAVTYDAAWAGFYLYAHNPIAIGSYDTLRFWIHGGSSGGQSISLWMRDINGNGTTPVPVTVRANTWTQVDIPLTNLNGLSNIADIIWQDTKGASQPTFYLDNIMLVSSQAAASEVTEVPTDAPTLTPTATEVPTNAPTLTPTATELPTNAPTLTPTATELPTNAPTLTPTATELPTNAPTLTPTATELPTNAPTLTATDEPATDQPAADATTFRETFDGEPASPQPWQPVNWDITVHSRDRDTWDELEPMEAAHGSDCSPHPATHTISAYEDTVFLCRNHMMTAIKASGYGLIYLTPDHMVDLSQGEAVIRFDLSTMRTSERDWVSLWISPYEDQLQLPLHDWLPDLNGVPRRGIEIEMSNFDGRTPFRAYLTRDFSTSELPTTWWTGYEEFLTTSAQRRDTFEVRLSRDHLKVGMPAYNFWWIDTPIEPLDWDQGVVQFGHHSYNPAKDCTDCGPNTWHWDNIEIAPAIPFTMIHADQRFVEPAGATEVSFVAPAPADAHLRFAGIGKNIEVSFDGGSTWEPAQMQAQVTNAEDSFQSYWTPIPEGTTQVQFRGKSWWGGDWHVRDISIWSQTRSSS